MAAGAEADFTHTAFDSCFSALAISLRQSLYYYNVTFCPSHVTCAWDTMADVNKLSNKSESSYSTVCLMIFMIQFQQVR